MSNFLVGLDLNDVQVDTFSGNASTTAFTLSAAATTNGAQVYISGIRQVPTTDFSIASTTITFSTAPVTGSSNVMVAYTKPAILNTPADASVTEAKMAGGLHTIWVPASAMRPTSSNGCAAITDVETTSGRPDMQVLDFDTSSDEHAQFQIGFPKSWNEGDITFRVFWTSTATDTDGVAWGLQGVSVANDATIDVAYGTGVVVTDDNISAAEDCLVTPISGNVEIASRAADTMTFFRIYRDVSDANDDMAEDARLIGVQIFYTTNTGGDT